MNNKLANSKKESHKKTSLEIVILIEKKLLFFQDVIQIILYIGNQIIQKYGIGAQVILHMFFLNVQIQIYHCTQLI